MLTVKWWAGGKKEEVMLCYEVVEKKILTVDLSSVKEVPVEKLRSR